jgi:hypothetical protein
MLLLQLFYLRKLGLERSKIGKTKLSKDRTFSSRKVTTLSNHSLKLANQLLFSSVVVMLSRRSVSWTSSWASSADMVEIEAVFCTCEAEIEVVMWEIRLTEPSKLGISVNEGTGTV